MFRIRFKLGSGSVKVLTKIEVQVCVCVCVGNIQPCPDRKETDEGGEKSKMGGSKMEREEDKEREIGRNNGEWRVGVQKQRKPLR